jgi:ATPase family associated with various cellular activities (AAA)
MRERNHGQFRPFCVEKHMSNAVTIATVLGGLPGQNVTVDAVTRPAVKTWLSRCGWQSSDYIGATIEQLQRWYCQNPGSWPERYVYDPVKALEAANAPYNPRDAALRTYLEGRGHVLPPPRTSFGGGQRVRVNTSGGAATVTTEQAATSTTSTASAAAAGDVAAQLAALIAQLGASGAGVNEQRVIELIRAHATVQHVVEVRDSEGTAQTVTGAHPQLATLLRVMQARTPNGFPLQALLVGPTASGKTHACEQAAEALGLAFYLHGAMAMSHELMGFTDAGGNYHRTPFRDAFENGGVVLLDELDSWDSSVTLALNAALANGVAAFPDGMVRRHRDCVVVGAANTYGTGATAEYVGRTRLDAAFLSRFPVKLRWERDPVIENAIAGGNVAWAERVRAARERAASAGLKHLIDPRHTAAGAALIASGMTADQAAELTYQAGLSAEQVRMVEHR